MKKVFIQTWRDCQFMNGWRFKMGLEMFNFEAMTGVPVCYIHDIDGNWLYFRTNDNAGLGMFIEVEGPKDAAEEIYLINKSYKKCGVIIFGRRNIL